MKLTITRSELDTCLARVSGAIPSSSVLPVLANILIEADESGLCMTGFDLDSGIQSRVPAKVERTGTTTLPGSTLLAVVRNLPPRDVHFEVEDNRLNLSCGSSSVKLYGIAAEEYPKLPKLDFEAPWIVDANTLRELVTRTAFAVSTEGSRPLLNGVLWELRQGSMKMVATDGHRLAAFGREVEGSASEDLDLIVPAGALRHVQKLFEGKDPVEVAQGDSYLGFRQRATLVFTRLIEGRYPDYRQVIPLDNPHQARVMKDDLNRAIATISPIASVQTRRMGIHLESGTALVYAVSADLGEAKDFAPVEYDGEPIDIGFNVNYLKESLTQVPSDEVVLTFRTNETPVVMRPPATSGGSEGDFLGLVMPLRMSERPKPETV